VSLRAFDMAPEQTLRRRRIAGDPHLTGLDYVELDGAFDQEAATFRLRLNFIPPTTGVVKPAVPAGLSLDRLRVVAEPASHPGSLQPVSFIAQPPVAEVPRALVVGIDRRGPISTALRAALIANGLPLPPGAAAQIVPVGKGETWFIPLPSSFHGYALAFGGTGARVEIPLADSPERLAIQLWLRREAPAAGVALALCAWQDASKQRRRTIAEIATRDDGHIVFAILPQQSDQMVAIASSSAVPLDTWVNVTCIFSDNSRFEIWLDGQRDMPASAAGLALRRPDRSLDPTIVIGAGLDATGAPARGFAGAIDDVRQWRTPPDGQALRLNLSRRLTGAETALAGYWPLDEGTGSMTGNRLPAGNPMGTLKAANGDAPRWMEADSPLVPFELFIDAPQAATFAVVTPFRTFVDVQMAFRDRAAVELNATYHITISNPAEIAVDRFFAGSTFSLAVDIPSAGDPRTTANMALPPPSGPPIDYLSRDYDALRTQILDRMAVLQPSWTERSPADLGVVLVELMANLGDYLSYYQDAVGTEAYLATARSRISVARHARLLDYRLSEGTNARAWIALEITATGDGQTVLGPRAGRPGTAFVAGAPAAPHAGCVAGRPLPVGAEIFEAMVDLVVHSELNHLEPYDWCGEVLALPAGSTSAALCFPYPVSPGARALFLPGRVVVIEQVRSPATGRTADADPSRRHAMRLTRVEAAADPVNLDRTQGRLFDVAWSAADALPFDLPIGSVRDPDTGTMEPTARLCANILLADHGASILDEELGTPDRTAPFRPRLQHGPVSQCVRRLDAAGRLERVDLLGPVSAVFDSTGTVLPDVSLHDDVNPAAIWSPRADLLQSDGFAREFVVEIHNDGIASLRFGDGQMGRKPEPGASFTARYRVGNGAVGNVGAETIAALDRAVPGIAFRSIRNPLPARGGTDREAISQAKIAAPQAFKVEARAVTADDYRAAARLDPEVEDALGDLIWIGSWYAVRVTVKRSGGRPVDAAFKSWLGQFLGASRLAGYTLLIEGPVRVPIRVDLIATPHADYLPQDVAASLADAFSSGTSRDGTKGYFNPDNWGFGESLYANRVIARAMTVPGVRSVEIAFFGRVRGPDVAPGTNRVISIDRREIVEVAGDPADPDRGIVNIKVTGGG
jgi:hypothetical protein